MDPSWSPAFVYTSRNASPEPVLDTSYQSWLHVTPDLVVPDRHTKSRHLVSKLEAIKEALCVCNRAHSCNDQYGLTAPTRLLYVGRDETDEIRVVICSEEIELAQRSSATYAALSYCWGTCPALKSTKSNLASRKRGLSISAIPLTIRDAVRVTRDLGLHYLWVDALCILQDCNEDWERESQRMGEVYGHAFVTIFAFGARDCEGGLSSPADQKSSTELDKSRWRFMDEPLNHRAWALQEWHLSPRRLIFTSYDVVFDCLQGLKQDFGHGVYSHRFLPSSIPSPRDWSLLVMNYSSRELTNPMDKLPAISGLAQRFDKLSNGRNGRYFAGLWEAYLPDSLLWHRLKVPIFLPEPNPARPTAYRAPTWSWASINGTVEFARDMLLESEWDVMAQVISVDLRPAGDNNPSGPMIHRLGLRAQMKSLRKEFLKESDPVTTIPNEEFTDFLLDIPGSQSTEVRTGRIWGDCIMRPFKEGPRTLKFCGVMKDKRNDWVWGLLLVEVDHANFQRIGCGWCRSWWFEDAVEAFAEIT